MLPTLSPRLLLMIALIAVALWQWLLIPRPRSAPFRILGALMVLALVVEIIGQVTLSMGLTNTIIYNWYGLLDAYLMLMILAHIGRWPKWRTIGFVAATTLIFIVDAHLATEDALLTNAIVITSLGLALANMYAAWDIARNSMVPLLRLPLFWMLMGHLIFYTALIPTMSLVFVVHAMDPMLAARLYVILPIITMLRYVLLAVACRLEAGWEPVPFRSMK